MNGWQENLKLGTIDLQSMLLNWEKISLKKLKGDRTVRHKAKGLWYLDEECY